MGVKKINDEIIGQIVTLLKLKWSLSMIVKELKKNKIFVTKSALQKIEKPVQSKFFFVGSCFCSYL